MGLMTLHGNGMEQSATQAIDWFRKAAEQELPDAQYSLARALLNGEGVEKDLLEAEKWYRAASENEIVEAHYRLAKMLLQAPPTSYFEPTLQCNMYLFTFPTRCAFFTSGFFHGSSREPTWSQK